MRNEHFQKAFNAWADSNHGLKAEASREVYEDVWNAFSDHAKASEPSQVQAADIGSFFEARAGRGKERVDLTQRYQARVVMLIDKVLDHEAEANGRKPPRAVRDFLKTNPALKLAMTRNRKEDEPDLGYLSREEFERLVEVLRAWPRDAARKHQERRWQDVRDRASVALQLAAGLSPTDIRRLEHTAGKAACKASTRVGEARAVWVPESGKLDERKAPIDEWAVPMLQEWLEVFASENLDTRWLFPGKEHAQTEWSKPSQYEVSRDIMRAAGTNGKSSFQLRHTWAMKHLNEGARERDVARWLGVREDEVMHRYRDALDEFRASW
jgi:integrase